MEYIVYDVLGHVEGITVRGMFSGWGVYLHGAIVGLIAEGEFYLKADKELVVKLKKEGMYPFTYSGHKDKIYEMSYMSVPEDTLNDKDAIETRVFESYEISLKASKSTKPNKPKKSNKK